MSEKREPWIDRAKGLLIFLVVLGHVAGAGGNLAHGTAADALQLIRNVIYMFHMPAFFVLAGLMWKSPSVAFLPFMRRKAKRLLLPYVVFGISSVAVFALVYGYAVWWQPLLSLLHAGGWPDGEGFRCNSVLWFLPVMFVSLMAWFMLDMMTRKLTSRNMVLLLSCFVLWSVRLVAYRCRVWFLPWGCVEVTWYLPFVVVGSLLRNVPIRFREGGLSLVLFVVVDLVRRCTNSNLMQVQGIVCHIAEAILGSMVCFAVARTDWFLRERWLAWTLESIGLMSMGIMLVHKFAVVFLQERVGWVSGLFHGNVGMALAGVALVTGVATAVSYWMSRGFRKWMPWCKI